MSRREQEIEHLFAAPASARARTRSTATPGCRSSYAAALARLLNYDEFPDDVERLIGKPGYVG